MKSLHIGVLAHSADGATLCFLEIIREASRRLGAHDHPEITLSILPMAPALRQYAAGDLHGVREHLHKTAARLAGAGCDFFVCPDNTAHMALELDTAELPLPGLHIAAIVAQQARDQGRRHVGVLGTNWTMEGPTYPSVFSQLGIRITTPSPSDRAMVDDVIFSELCQGILRDESRAAYVQVIERLRDEGCDAVVLGCTEIPLLITPEISPLPTLDSTRLLAREAVTVALSGRVPVWRGGPVHSFA